MGVLLAHFPGEPPSPHESLRFQGAWNQSQGQSQKKKQSQSQRQRTGVSAPHERRGLNMFAGVWQAGGMKKQFGDTSFHDRRYQERKRAEAARKAPKKKVEKKSGEARVAGSE